MTRVTKATASDGPSRAEENDWQTCDDRRKDDVPRARHGGWGSIVTAIDAHDGGHFRHRRPNG